MNVVTTTGSVPVPRRDAAISALPPAAELSTRRKVLAFGMMCLGCFMAYLDIQIVIVSIQEIGGGLAASQVELSWIMTSYLIAEIIVIPLIGLVEPGHVDAMAALLPRPPGSLWQAYCAAPRGTSAR